MESTGIFAFSYCTSLTISGYPNSLERDFATNNNINFEPKYKVTNKLNNITSDNENIAVNYTTTLKADSGYKLPRNIKIIINNTELEEGKDYTYDRTNGNIVIFDTAIIGNIEIEAVGEKLIKVSFDANGGEFSEGTNIINFDDANDCYFDNLSIPTRDGYKFIGYYTEKTGGTSMSDFFNNEAGITEDTTFYAHWEVIQEDMILEDNTGNTTTDDSNTNISGTSTDNTNTDNTNTDNTNTNTNNNTNSGKNPQTSDNIMLYVSILGISIIGITATTKIRKKLKNN